MSPHRDSLDERWDLILMTEDSCRRDYIDSLGTWHRLIVVDSRYTRGGHIDSNAMVARLDKGINEHWRINCGRRVGNCSPFINEVEVGGHNAELGESPPCHSSDESGTTAQVRLLRFFAKLASGVTQLRKTNAAAMYARGLPLYSESDGAYLLPQASPLQLRIELDVRLYGNHWLSKVLMRSDVHKHMPGLVR